MSLQIQESLKEFGLTGQEAAIYETLLVNGEMSGYEVSKETGISRSYVYGALVNLVDKGAAYLIEGDVAKYTPVAMETFCNNTIKNLSKKATYLIEHAPKKKIVTDGYITIQGTSRIEDKLEEMLDKCEKRLYLMASSAVCELLHETLCKLVRDGKKTVILSDRDVIEGSIFYETAIEPYQIRLITDSSFVLTGTYGDEGNDACLYSGQANLVTVMKEALGNRISLIELEEKEK